MKTAICISGHLRSFNLTKTNLKYHFDNFIKNYDIFAYIPNTNENINEFVETFPLAKIEVCDDSPIDMSRMPSAHLFKTGPQAYLQQIHGWYKVNQLRKKEETEKGFNYDFIVRCRPDIKFLTQLPDIETLKTDRLYIPKFHSWGGYNDRFCIGANNLIDNYMDIFEFFKKRPELCTHAETFLKTTLDLTNTQVELIDVKFNRVLTNGHELSDD